MSNAIETSVLRAELPRTRVPTVYFIDDSATMREVIKIAFRRENINVITCPDAATALAQFEQTAPDAVITDVIMPDKDGYEVCQHLKQDPRYSHIPVILMSGVVNKTVAEKAISVKADELIRKPFQPQELIGRVRALLQTKASDTSDAESRRAQSSQAAQPLSGFFAPAAQQQPANQQQPAMGQDAGRMPAQNVPPLPATGEFAWPRALAEAMVKQSESKSAAPRPTSTEVATPGRSAGASQSDVQRLRNEIMRLELLVKKLQTELTIEKQYCAALELHIRTLQESD